MTFEEFAREILIADLRINGISNEQQAKAAIKLADAFIRELNARDLRVSDGLGLTEEEINLIRNQEVLAAVKSVRNRLQIPLMEAKSLVLKAKTLVDADPLRRGL